MQKSLSVRIQPASGEALACFLNRISQLNGQSLMSVYPNIKPDTKKSLKQEDILRLDVCPRNILDLNKIKKMMNLDQSDMLEHSFWSLLSHFVFEDEISSTKIMRNLLRKHYFYCPDCLREAPFRRLLWNVNLINGCLTHRRQLVDKCLSCDQKIPLIYLQDCSICPKCNSSFLDENGKGDVHDNGIDFDYQQFIYEAFTQLCNIKQRGIQDGPVIALKLIYIIQGFSKHFDYKYFTSCFDSIGRARGFLQQARGTTKRRVHISQLIEVLYRYKISVESFLSLEIPYSFRDEVLQNKNVLWKFTIIYCIAPWCASNNKAKLVNLKSLKFVRNDVSDKKGKHCICLDCGCEYTIFEEGGAIIERTHFIQFYKKMLGNSNLIDCSLSQLEVITGMDRSVCRRMNAYFIGRGLLGFPKFQFEKSLLHNFISELCNNRTIDSIRYRSCWKGFDHFLIYRYHPDVVKIHTTRKNNQPFRKFTKDIS